MAGGRVDQWDAEREGVGGQKVGVGEGLGSEKL